MRRVVLLALLLIGCARTRDEARADPSVRPSQRALPPKATTPSRLPQRYGPPPKMSVLPHRAQGACIGKLGCLSPRVVQPCVNPHADAWALDEVLEREEELLGRRVEVRSVLTKSGGSVTEAGCWGHACCNHSEAAIGLGAIQLFDADDPALYLCRGDETATCCSLAWKEAGEVVVTGVLRRDPSSSTTWIDDARVCTQ